MEKISGIPGNIDIQNKNKLKQSESNVSFKDTLDKTIMQPTQTGQANQMNALGEIQALQQNSIQVSPSIVAEKTDSLLNLMEAYSAELRNPAKTLKDIEPLVRQLRDSASELSDQAGQLNPENKDLKMIAQDSAATANIEYIKFNRGDYL